MEVPVQLAHIGADPAAANDPRAPAAEVVPVPVRRVAAPDDESHPPRGALSGLPADSRLAIGG